MKGVFTRITMNMDGVQLNILYIYGKCITIKKTMKLAYSIQLLLISLLPSSSLTPPAMIPPPPLLQNGIHHHRQVCRGCPWMPPPSRLPMRITCVKVIVVLIADGGGASLSTLHPARTTTPCAMNSRATILPTKVAVVRED